MKALLLLTLIAPLLNALVAPAARLIPGRSARLLPATIAGVAALVYSILFFRNPELSSSASFVARWIDAFDFRLDWTLDGFNSVVLFFGNWIFFGFFLKRAAADGGKASLLELALVSLLQFSVNGALLSGDGLLLFWFVALGALVSFFFIYLFGLERSDAEDAAKRYARTQSFALVLLLFTILSLYFSKEPHAFSLASYDLARTDPDGFALTGLSLPYREMLLVVVLLATHLLGALPPFSLWSKKVMASLRFDHATFLVSTHMVFGIVVFYRLFLSIGNDHARELQIALAIIGLFQLCVALLGISTCETIRDFVRGFAHWNVGWILLGFSGLHERSWTGALLLLVGAWIALAEIGLVFDSIESRLDRELRLEPLHLMRTSPQIGFTAGMTIAQFFGVPGFMGFVSMGYILSFLLGLEVFWAYFAVALVPLFGWVALYRSRTLFFRSPVQAFEGPRLSLLEIASIWPLILALVWVGFYPSPWLHRLQKSAQGIVGRIHD